MMKELIDTMHSGDYELALLHEGREHCYAGRGVRTLYNLLAEAPELLLNSKAVAKAVGTTAAKKMVEGGVVEVYADYISQTAYDTLQDAHIRVSYGKKVSHQEFLKIWERLGE